MRSRFNLVFFPNGLSACLCTRVCSLYRIALGVLRAKGIRCLESCTPVSFHHDMLYTFFKFHTSTNRIMFFFTSLTSKGAHNSSHPLRRGVRAGKKAGTRISPLDHTRRLRRVALVCGLYVASIFAQHSIDSSGKCFFHLFYKHRFLSRVCTLLTLALHHRAEPACACFQCPMMLFLTETPPLLINLPPPSYHLAFSGALHVCASLMLAVTVSLSDSLYLSLTLSLDISPLFLNLIYRSPLPPSRRGGGNPRQQQKPPQPPRSSPLRSPPQKSQRPRPPLPRAPTAMRHRLQQALASRPGYPPTMPATVCRMRSTTKMLLPLTSP